MVTVRPGDGAITDLFGGFGFNREFDVASQGRRQPGSAFKPLVYLAALQDGLDPRSTLDATSVSVGEFGFFRSRLHAPSATAATAAAHCFRMRMGSLRGGQ